MPTSQPNQTTATPSDSATLGPRRGVHRLAVDLPPHLPARMVNEFVYCPRLFFYEWVERLFAHSSDTLEGSFRHEKLERRADPLPPPDDTSEQPVRSRSVTLSSDRHGLVATIDLVEGDGGAVVPVDYKRGSPKEGEDGPEAWPADRAQVCVQAIILRDNGYTCREAVLYYDTTKQRVRVPIDDAIVESTLRAVEEARAVAASGRIPPPLIDSPKCPRCSLVPICLPDETAVSMWLPPEGTEEQLLLFREEGDEQPTPRRKLEAGKVRRLVPARDDLRPLYVVGHALSIGKSSEVLRIKERGKLIQEARIGEISQVNLFGNVQITPAAIQGLAWAEKPIAHFTFGGWFHALTQGLGLKNVFLRRDQFRRAEDPGFCLRLARDVVVSKIRNQRVLLQRNHVDPPPATVKMLRVFAERAANAADLDELLGIEGVAARMYFEQFGGMLKGETGDALRFDFRERNRRPPRDPVNALLSFAYSLLAKDLTITCHVVGFDPFVGFYHQPRFGRPALALDLMEGFRPLIADSAVLGAVNNRMVSSEDFLSVGDAVALKPAGRKRFIHAYEQRMDGLVTHPLFGYRVNYRRILEVQTRLLARFVSGEIARYPGFETR